MKNRFWIPTTVLTFFVLELFAQTGPLDKSQIRYEYFSHPSGYFGMSAELNSDMQFDGERIFYNYTSSDSTIVARLHYQRKCLVDTAIINAPDLQLNAFFIAPDGYKYKNVEIPELIEKGVPHGLYIKKNLQNGVIIASQKYTYSYGRQNGACEEFWLNNFNDRSSGRWKYYNMTEDVLDGNYLVKLESGDTIEYGLYKMGRKEGCWQTRKYEGEKHLMCYQNNLRHGDYKAWNKSGVLLIEGHYEKDLLEGQYRTWYNNGQLASEAYYKNAVIQQTYRAWYRDGKLQQLSQYDSSGKLNGVNEWYFQNGQLSSREHFVHEQREGVSETWNYEGVLTERAHYHTGMREGKSEYFYASGKLHQEKYYHQDELNGTVKAWDEKGKLITHKVYKDGHLVKTYLNLYIEDDEDLQDRNIDYMGLGTSDEGEGQPDSDFSRKVFRISYYDVGLNCVRDYSRALSDSMNAYYAQLSKKQQKRWKNIQQLEITIHLNKNKLVITQLSGADEVLNQELLAFAQRVMKGKYCYAYTPIRIKILIPRQRVEAGK